MFYFRRRAPNGKEIHVVTDPQQEDEKMYAKNDKTTSKLVITNLELYDSGIYELFADNGVYTRNISVILLVKGNYIPKYTY